MQAAALGVAPLVQFVDGSKIHPIRVMKVSDFAWVTADHDAGARGCLGAMAAGKAIVAERSQTIDYFLADGINGTALPGGNPSAMAAAVADVVVRAETRVAWGHAGRSRAMRELRLETMVDGFDRAVQAADPVGAAR
jgi:glycosyltransferase involved in cell wall biosynthesis